MNFPRAIYGNDRGGHAFLGGSGAEHKELYSAIAWRTDLPANAPYNLAWQPFLRGFPESGHYVLVWTIPDLSAHRAGMVSSSAAFIPFAAMTQSLDFQPIVAALRETPRGDALQPLKAVYRELPDTSRPTAKSLAIVEAMVQAKRHPVVHLGQDFFDDAMVEILGRLPVGLKRTFAFRLSFGPQDVENDHQTVVSSPIALERRWHEFAVVGPAAETTSPSAATLLGLPEGADLTAFADGIGIEVADLRSLSLLTSAFELSRAADTSTGRSIALLRLVAALSPNAAKGAGLKQRLISEAARSIASMSAGDLRSIKNLDTSAFPDGSEIWRAVSARTASILRGVTESDAVFAIVRDAVSNDGVKPWAESVLKGFDTAVSPLDATTAAAVWGDVLRHPDSGAAVVELLPEDAATEVSLTSCFPLDLAGDTARLLLGSARDRKWLIFHGRLLAACMPPDAAIRSQLEIDVDPTFDSGLAAALSKATDEDILNLALSEPDARLVRFASDACAQRRDLLRAFEPQNRRWIDILQATLDRSPDAIEGIGRPRELFDVLISQQAQHAAFDTLWKSLASSPAADLWDIPARRDVWRKIPIAVRRDFVAATADGWLAARENERHNEKSVETELENAIAEPGRINAFISRGIPDRLESTVRLFQQLPRLSEIQFLDLLAQIDARMKFGGVDERAARTIGDVTNMRFWGAAANRILEMARRRGDMVTALLHCRLRLALADQINIYFWGIDRMPDPDEDELWRIFESISVALYPYGPQENEIWSRAGGSMDALPSSGNPRSLWHAAARRLRSGGGGTTVGRLLAEMRGEFPANKDLESISAFGIFKHTGSEG